MPDSNEDSGSSEGRPKLDTRLIGKFILWAIVALVGWSFYSTMKHETSLAVLEREIQHINEKILIDQRLSGIERKLGVGGP